MRVMELSGWGLENLRMTVRADPSPGEGQVVVAMEAASINYRDLVMARGGYGRRGGVPPFVPVSDGAGRVVATGKKVAGVAVGDLVCPHMAQNWIDGPFHDNVWAGMLGGPLDGVLQQLMVLPEAGVVKAAPHLDAMAAASLPCAALTAWNAIAQHVKPGDVVLTQGTGGVSQQSFAGAARTTGGARDGRSGDLVAVVWRSCIKHASRTRPGRESRYRCRRRPASSGAGAGAKRAIRGSATSQRFGFGNAHHRQQIRLVRRSIVRLCRLIRRRQHHLSRRDRRLL